MMSSGIDAEYSAKKFVSIVKDCKVESGQFIFLGMMVSLYHTEQLQLPHDGNLAALVGIKLSLATHATECKQNFMCFVKFVYFCGVDMIDLFRAVYLFFAVQEAILYEM